MVEAIVGVALRAILASVLLGGVLAGLVLIATRALALTAATRHALWTMALIATAVMPLGGILVSVSRAYAAAEPASRPSTVTASAQRWASTTHDGPSAAAPRTATASRANSDRVLPRLDLAFTHFTPRVSRAIALGVVGVWLTGVLIGLIGLAAGIVRVRGLKRRSSPLDGTLADELPWLTEVAAGREIYLRLSFETETPVAIGFRRPVILIPTDLATADGLSAIEQLVLHEYAHLRRYDDWTNLVQRTIERIFWFNPIVWLVGRKIALEREIASDDAVVDKTGEPHAYATSLWKLAREMRMPEHAVVAPGALLTRKQITIRIEQLLDKKRSRLHRSPAAALGIAVAGMLAIAFVATSAPAVELPAIASTEPIAAAKPLKPPAKAVAHTWHAERSASRVAKGGAPAPVADKAATIPGTHPAVPETRVIRIVQTVVAPVSAPKPKPLAVVPPPHELPAEPPLPPIGPAGTLPPLPAVPTFSPETLGKLRAGSAVRARDAMSAAGVGIEVSRVIHEVMSSVPREIAQESSSSKGVRMFGISARHFGPGGASFRNLIATCTGCDFSRLDLHAQDLHGIALSGADLSYADLRDANLSGVRFNGVNLSHANLAGTDLSNARLEGCDLTGVDLHGARTTGMTMHGIGLDG